MTKNKILLVFFALVFCLCSFADCETDRAYALLQIEQAYSNNLAISQNADYITANLSKASLISHPSEMSPYLSASQSASYAISNDSLSLNSKLGVLESFVRSIDCSTNCVDLSPIVTLLQQINTVLGYVRSDVQSIKTASQHLEICVNDGFNRLNSSQNEIIFSVSNLTDIVSYDLGNISGAISTATNILFSIDSTLSGFSSHLFSIVQDVDSIGFYTEKLYDSVGSIYTLLSDYIEYLSYLETIDSSLAYLASNEYFSVNVNNLTNFFANSMSVGVYTPSYNSLDYNEVLSRRSLTTPYNSPMSFHRANLKDVLDGGFINCIGALTSLNNYFSWLYNYLPSNIVDTSEISSGLSSISNTLNRVDSYVLGDFSNQFYKVYSLLDTLVSNQLNSATNNLGLSALIETNNIYTASNTFLLASIDSKLDVLDYIKILSDTPLAEYSGDVDYFDYLTNLYINGSSSSGVASTNWFERMEILLASLVFGDSDGTNGVPQGVEMEGVDSSVVESALTDYSYSSDFTSGIESLDQTKQNFFQILNSFHQSVKSVSCPASVSIGIGGLDGEDTRDFNDLMHGHFQVSFSVGSSDVFTTVVRSVTTICWVLVFLVIFWKAGFWLLRKMIYLYRVVNRLFWSVFTR